MVSKLGIVARAIPVALFVGILLAPAAQGAPGPGMTGQMSGGGMGGGGMGDGGGMGGSLAHLGMMLFFDTTLSSPDGQSCASCHASGAAFADPNQTRPVSEEAVKGRFGTRNSPSAAYAAQIPPFGMVNGRYVGGQFWDGRASTLVDQAKGPFVNPVEMNNENPEAVVASVKSTHYGQMMYSQVFPGGYTDTATDYNNIATAIAEYEKSTALNRFDSKYDYYQRGRASLTSQEKSGLNLFNGKGNCATCHPSSGSNARFSSYVYENLGLPSNPRIAELLGNMPAPDLGLGAVVNDSTQNGKFRVPSLRNVARTAPYGHNGYFTSLKQTVQFMNTAGVPKASWPTPEVNQNWSASRWATWVSPTGR